MSDQVLNKSFLAGNLWVFWLNHVPPKKTPPGKQTKTHFSKWKINRPHSGAIGNEKWNEPVPFKETTSKGWSFLGSFQFSFPEKQVSEAWSSRFERLESGYPFCFSPFSSILVGEPNLPTKKGGEKGTDRWGTQL